MTQADAFLQAIIESPDDDVPRLVYADWLDDHGQPERAEFIRVQVELARLPEGIGPRRADLEARERQLLEEHEDKWAGRVRDWAAAWSFRRGMLAIIIRAKPLLAISARTGVDDWFRRAMVLEMHVLDAAPHIRELARSRHLARLASIRLSGGRIGDVHVQALAASPHLAGLTTLDLSHNTIGGGGVQALATGRQLPRLRRLDLSYNDIDDADVVTLARSWGLPSLTDLDLSHNPIVSPGEGAKLLQARFGSRVLF